MPSRPYDDDENEPAPSGPEAGSDDPSRDPTEQLVAPAVGDRCAACDAPLVSDQRYCLNCGERRGKARFSFASPASAPPPAAAPAGSGQRARPSSGATLIAGIATLLLAMGVGVLIGHNGNNDNARPVAATPPIITVGGGGAGAGSVSSTGGQSVSRHRGNAAAVKAPKVVITKKVAQAATQAAGKVLGGNSNLAPPTVQPGASCTHGAGCQNGKFTGNFFGGG